jgi:hypothetical protein
MRTAKSRPSVAQEAQGFHAVERAKVTNLLGVAGDEHTPAGTAVRIGVVDLEGDENLHQRRRQLAARIRSEHDIVVEQRIVHRQDHGRLADTESNPSQRAGAEERQTFVRREGLETSARHLAGPGEKAAPVSIASRCSNVPFRSRSPPLDSSMTILIVHGA